MSGDRPRRRKGTAAQTPPPSDAQRRLVATSRALWIKADGFVENGRYGTHFGESAEEAAAMLEAIGYRHSPATPEFLKKR